MKLKSIALAAIATAIIAHPAQAAVYVMTFKGVVSLGVDGAGEFGAAGANLAGANFTADYFYDDSIAGGSAVNDGISENRKWGGTQIGSASFLSANLTINGVTKLFPGLFFGQLNRANNLRGSDFVMNEVSDYYEDSSKIISMDLYNRIEGSNNFINSIGFSDPLSYSTILGNLGDGAFFIREFNKSTNTYTRNLSARLTTSSISISPTSAVPEPASWAMFISGFGLIGGGMRYRQRRRSISFA